MSLSNIFCSFLLVTSLTMSLFIPRSTRAVEIPKVPVQLAKTGVKLKSEYIVQPTGVPQLQDEKSVGEGIDGGNLEPEIVDNTNSESIEYSNEDTVDPMIIDEEMDESRCGKGKYWHIRGNRCVELNCPSKKRDYVTGNCVTLYVNSNGYYNNRYNRPPYRGRDSRNRARPSIGFFFRRGGRIG